MASPPSDTPVSEGEIEKFPTPEKLRSIASMLDLMDVILGKLKIGGVEGDDLVTRMKALQGTDMQADLRTWADSLEERTVTFHRHERGLPCNERCVDV